MTSGGLWVALVWFAIIGSRPVSLWFGGGFHPEKPEDYLDGSPLDRNIFILLLVLALLVLWKRKSELGTILRSNRWFSAFVVFCFLSVLWSGFPLVSLKRWVKDLGQIGAVLIIATEYDPVGAAKAVFARYAYLALPISVLLIKYYPELGRYYDIWTWTPSAAGVTTNKNELGSAVLICGLYLVWELIENWRVKPALATPSPSNAISKSRGSRFQDMDLQGRRHLPAVSRVGHVQGRKKDENNGKADLVIRGLLLLTVFWLLHQAGSSTATTCLVLGTGSFLLIRFPAVRRQAKYLGTYTLIFVALTLAFYAFPGVFETLVGSLGRDMTFTGRTDLWADLLRARINPLLGSGYQSFWLGDYAEFMWHKYYFHPVQAHNGYLEMYLQGGFVGLFLLVAVIVSAGGKLKQDLMDGDAYARLRFTFLVVAVFNNWTEAFFVKLHLIWVITLLVALSESRRHPSPAVQTVPERENDGLFTDRPGRAAKADAAPIFIRQGFTDR